MSSVISSIVDLLKKIPNRLLNLAIIHSPIKSTGAKCTGMLKYQRHKPEQTLLYQIIEKYYPQFLTHMGQQDKGLSKYVRSEFEEYLKCGRLEYGFLRVRCEDCHCEHLVDDALPHEPIRQWVLSFPFQLRFLFASYPQLMGKVLGILYRTLATHITKKAGYDKQTGAVTLIQQFGLALNLNIHFHMLYLDVYMPKITMEKRVLTR